MRLLPIVAMVLGCSRTLYLPDATPEPPEPAGRTFDMSTADLANAASPDLALIDLALVDLAPNADLTTAPDLGPDPHCRGEGGAVKWSRRWGDVGGLNYALLLFRTDDRHLLSGLYGGQITFPPLPQLTTGAALLGNFSLELDPSGTPKSQSGDLTLAAADGGKQVTSSGQSLTLHYGARTKTIDAPAVTYVKATVAGPGFVLAGVTAGDSTIDFGAGSQPTGDQGLMFISRWDDDFNLVRVQLFPTLASSNPSITVDAVEADSKGNLFVTGMVGASGGIGDGVPQKASTHYFAKYDANGTLLWKRTEPAYFQRLAILPSGQPIRARTDLQANDRWLVSVEKLDDAGATVWSWSFESQRAITHGLAVTPSGETVWMGWVLGDTDLGGGLLPQISLDGDMALAKLDAAGKHVWSKRFGDSPLPRNTGSASGTHQLVIDPDGTIVVSGIAVGDFNYCGVPGPEMLHKGVTEIVVSAFSE
jgi:hypothetical protein